MSLGFSLSALGARGLVDAALTWSPGFFDSDEPFYIFDKSKLFVEHSVVFAQL
jgi:hypothetical protein